MNPPVRNRPRIDWDLLLFLLERAGMRPLCFACFHIVGEEVQRLFVPNDNRQRYSREKSSAGDVENKLQLGTAGNTPVYRERKRRLTLGTLSRTDVREVCRSGSDRDAGRFRSQRPVSSV